MKKNVLLLPMLGLLVSMPPLVAKEPPVVNSGKTTAGQSMKVMAELCSPATAQSDLNINNVRATILGGGDMWWDLNNARYEVPKGSNKHSMFAGALWLGGVDEGNQLKLAAMTYRQRGNDFWPGPLTTDGSASVDKTVCDKYDRHFLITREEVEIHRAWLICKENPDCNEAVEFPGYESSIPLSIQNWPGNGVEGELPYNLAPFIDMDQDGVYDPTYDYPAYDLDRAFDCRKKEVDILYGDQTLWWVYNDRGNVHTETQAGALGFEIRAQAFAFSTNDEINNMTFNNYRIINRSTFRLTNTYFGTWFDPDLGNYNDDIIGSDIARGLGYCYNSDPNDEGPLGYGENPPAVGFDFFQGPFADYFDGRDNDRDGCVDGVRGPDGQCDPEDPTTGVNERIIMSGFMYYNNSGSQGVVGQTTDPDNAAEFYNYLQSRWKNGNPLVVENPSGLGQNGNGDGFTADGSGQATLYAYPGVSYDTTGTTPPIAPIPGGGWYEAPSNKADKRGLHCAGPFSLAPGALNFITTGVVWARDFVRDDIFASVEQVIIADDRAQKLFDNCFQVLNGPTAPAVEIQELDRAVVIALSNPSNSNNYKLSYMEFDPVIPAHQGNFDSEADSIRYYNYVFEGYQIFQLRSSDVGVTELYDATQARLVAQVDIENDVTKLINYEKDQSMGVNVPQDMTLSEANDGIRHSFYITEDAFASGDRRLVNHKEYYYMVVAYGVNNYDQFDQAPTGSFQAKPYLAGRLGITTYQAIPHITSPEANGTVANAEYGDGPPITRIEGIGNGGNFLELTEESKVQILLNNKMDQPTYVGGFGPINVKVVDPLKVVKGVYTLSFDSEGDNARWFLTDALGNPVAESDSTVSFYNEQIVPDLGISITIVNVPAPGGDEEGTRDNGVIGATITFDDVTKPWLTGVPDGSGYDPFNWILAGGNTEATGQPASTYTDIAGDPLNFFGRILDGTWAPYAYVSAVSLGNGAGTAGLGPASGVGRPSVADAHGVDVVLTNDRSKWTRVPVLEMQEDQTLAIGNARKLSLRQSAGWDLSGGQLVRNESLIGWSYFPGYAIDVETGQRLNIVFGENSWLPAQNGDDMLWNPTSTYTVSPGNPINDGIVLGGQHVIYILNSSTVISGSPVDLTYQGDDPNAHPLKSLIDNLGATGGAGNIARANFYKTMMWTSIPMLAPGYSDVNPSVSMPSGVTVRLRLDRPYEDYVTDNSNNGHPRYQFDLSGLATTTNNMATATSALDLIRVVPNPYYAASAYEDSQLDNIVKITNLPVTCTITIFSTNGTVIRKIRKDNADTYVEWDLKNDYNVPIASGVYLIHVDAGAIGEKIVKWFGAMRPVDLNAF